MPDLAYRRIDRSPLYILVYPHHPKIATPTAKTVMMPATAANMTPSAVSRTSRRRKELAFITVSIRCVTLDALILPHPPLIALTQPPHQILSPQVRVALQHLHSLMPGNRGHFHQPQALLKQPARGLMPQVVEGQALDTPAALQTFSKAWEIESGRTL